MIEYIRRRLVKQAARRDEANEELQRLENACSVRMR
jgi:hypothetical protein